MWITLENFLRCRYTHQLDHLKRAIVCFFLLHLGMMDQNTFANLIPCLHDRIQRCHGLLENHTYTVSAKRFHLRARKRGQINALKNNLAARNMCGWLWQESHNRKCRHGLAAAGLSHNGKRLSAAHAKRKIIQSGKFAVFGRQRNAQVFYAQKNFFVALFFSLFTCSFLGKFTLFKAAKLSNVFRVSHVFLLTSASLDQERRARRHQVN